VFTEPCDEIVLLRDIRSTASASTTCCRSSQGPRGLPASGKVLGVSKLARIVDCFAHRLQCQERLTGQIADFLMEKLKPQGVAVVLHASHSCMTIRGIRKPGSMMVTSALRGIFKRAARSRSEVLSLMHNDKG
jgi:GTP cyclohydrolase I